MIYTAEKFTHKHKTERRQNVIDVQPKKNMLKVGI